MTPSTRKTLGASPARFGVGLAVWLALRPSAAVGDLLIGVCAAWAAAWLSGRLAPSGPARVDAVALLGYLPRFWLQSLRGGLDVARRAFAPDMRLQPGIVDAPTRLPRGFARNTFTTITSLMPGSLPCGETASALRYHCLDTSQPVAQQIEAEEGALRSALLPEAP